MDNVLEVNEMQKSFGEKMVLQSITLHLKKGENLAILGKSGSGKSVLIKCIIGLIPLNSGEIHLWGKSLSDLKEKELNVLRKKIGFLFQSAALYDSMTVRENLEFPLRNDRELTTSEKENRILKTLENVGLSEAINKYPSELSGGMRKRIGLARTLMLNPEIMLYDEPTTGLDPITAKEISQLIVQLQKDTGTSSIIITHDMHCAKIASDRIAILNEGTFVGEGTFEELRNADNPFIQSFFEPY
jgi:phospholipid/cholesterol/gamma-HCH transport system ATP-binding protein